MDTTNSLLQIIHFQKMDLSTLDIPTLDVIFHVPYLTFVVYYNVRVLHCRCLSVQCNGCTIILSMIFVLWFGKECFMKLKGMQLTDWLIIILMTAIIALDMDFGNLQTIDYVCLAAYGFWLVALVVRLYIVNREKQ